MMIKMNKTAWGLLAWILLIAGCSLHENQIPSTPTEQLQAQIPTAAVAATFPTGKTAAVAATFPTGKFVNGNNTWEFNADGSFNSSGPQGNETGTYTAKGNLVVITCQSCGAIKGSYTWSFQNSTLTFKAIDDACSNRLKVVGAGQWKMTP